MSAEFEKPCPRRGTVAQGTFEVNKPGTVELKVGLCLCQMNHPWSQGACCLPMACQWLANVFSPSTYNLNDEPLSSFASTSSLCFQIPTCDLTLRLWCPAPSTAKAGYPYNRPLFSSI